MKKYSPAIIISLIFVLNIILFNTSKIIEVFIFFLISIILALIFKKRFLIPYLILAPLAFTTFLMAHNLQTRQITNLNGTSQVLHAEITTYPKIYTENMRAEIKIKLRNGNTIKTLAYMDTNSIEIGDKFTAKFNFYRPNILDGNDREKSNFAKGIYILASAEEISKTGKVAKIFYFPKIFLEKLKNAAFDILEYENAALLNAICFGEKSFLDDNISNDIKSAGLSHVLAVSGMHLGFIVGFATLFFGKRRGSVIAMILIVLFVFMLGATPSLLRASIMYFLFAIANLIDRENNSINSLFIALLIILLINPDNLFSRGLQLSFMACVGILIIAPKLNQKFYNFCNKGGYLWIKSKTIIISSINCSISAIIFTFPILIYHFGSASILSPISNILAIIPISIIFVVGIIALIIFVVFNINPLNTILEFLLSLIYKITTFIANLDFGVVYSDDKVLVLLVIISLIVITLWALDKIKLKSIIIIIFITSSLGIYINYNNNPIYIDILATGSGQSILVYDKTETVLIDCGASAHRNAANSVANRLREKNIKNIDTLILTAIDKTHSRDVVDLFNKITISNVIIPRNTRNTDTKTQILDFIAKNNINITENPKFENNLAISINTDIDRKLIVEIGDITTIHSLTPKMLAKFLENNTITAKTLIISDANMSENFRENMNKINADEIILSGTRDRIKSTMSEGNIYLRRLGELSEKVKK